MANALRFPPWWEHVEDTSVQRMRGEYRNSVVGHSGQPISFDVRSTPLARVSDVCSVVGSIVHEFGPVTVQYSILRYDPADAPNFVNLDDYLVWTDLRAHPALKEMIHGRVRTATQNWMVLSIRAPYFARSKKNIVWEGRGEHLPASSGAENQPQ